MNLFIFHFDPLGGSSLCSSPSPGLGVGLRLIYMSPIPLVRVPLVFVSSKTEKYVNCDFEVLNVFTYYPKQQGWSYTCLDPTHPRQHCVLQLWRKKARPICRIHGVSVTDWLAGDYGWLA